MEKLRRILVVDGSRVVRATLGKHLQGEFEIVEETDGESAWQTLMLDANIAAVVSGLHTPKLEAHDLLARLRVSSMRRLRSIPFVLIVSELNSRAEREFDKTCGVAGFITKSMKKSDIINYLQDLLGGASGHPGKVLEGESAPEAVEVFEAVDAVEPMLLPLELPLLPDSSQPTHSSLSLMPEVDGGKLLTTESFAAVLTAIPCTGAADDAVCALVFGIDNHEQVIKTFGEEVAEVIAERFASLLIAKVGPADSIGRWREDQLAIVSHGVDLKQAVKFGHRVCKSLASGQISIRGKKIRLTASVGVASSSDDQVSNGRELLALAEKRLDQALVCGGNTVATEFKAACPLHCQKSLTATVLDALSAQEEKNLSANIGSLGLKLLPLLQVMDKELSLGLPLARMAQLLEQRAEFEVAG